MLKQIAALAFFAAAAVAQQPDWVHQVANKPFADPRQYNFAPQFVSALAIGLNTVTWTGAVPPGIVNGGKLLVVGSGITEVATVGSVTSTTVQITCGSAHPLGAQISSASAGANEAYAAGNTDVRFPAGSFTTYTSITVAGGGTVLRGAGAAATTISESSAVSAFDAIVIGGSSASNVEISGFTVTPGQYPSVNYAVNDGGGSYHWISDIVTSMAYGIGIFACNQCEVSRVVASNVTSAGYAVYAVGCSKTTIHDLQAASHNTGSPGYSAVYISGNSSELAVDHVWAPYFSVPVYVTTTGAQVISDVAFSHVFLDNPVTAGVGVLTQVGSTGGIYRVTCLDCRVTNSSGDGVHLEGDGGYIYGFKFVGGRVLNSAGYYGVEIEGSVNDVQVADSTVGGSSNFDIFAWNGALRVAVRNNVIGLADGTTAGVNSYGVYLFSGVGDYASVTGNVFVAGSFANGQIYDNSTGSNTVVSGNTGVSITPPTITCSSSPCTIPAAHIHYPSTLYLLGGTVTNVTVGPSSKVACTSTPCVVQLPPNYTATVTYSVVPTTLSLVPGQ